MYLGNALSLAGERGESLQPPFRGRWLTGVSNISPVGIWSCGEGQPRFADLMSSFRRKALLRLLPFQTMITPRIMRRRTKLPTAMPTLALRSRGPLSNQAGSGVAMGVGEVMPTLLVEKGSPSTPTVTPGSGRCLHPAWSTVTTRQTLVVVYHQEVGYAYSWP